MTRRRPRLVAGRLGLAAVLGLGLALALGGCKRSLDLDELQGKLKDWANKEIAPVSAIACPKVPIKKDTSFECKVDFTGGQSYQLKVTFLDEDGNIHFEWTKPLFSAERLAQLVTEQIKAQQQKDIQLDCGKGLLEVPADGTRCAVTESGKSGHLRVKVDLKTQDVSWTVEP